MEQRYPSSTHTTFSIMTKFPGAATLHFIHPSYSMVSCAHKANIPSLSCLPPFPFPPIPNSLFHLRSILRTLHRLLRLCDLLLAGPRACGLDLVFKLFEGVGYALAERGEDGFGFVNGCALGDVSLIYPRVKLRNRSSSRILPPSSLWRRSGV